MLLLATIRCLANSSSSTEVTLTLFNTKVSFLDEAKSGNKKCNLIQTPTILVTNYQNRKQRLVLILQHSKKYRRYSYVPTKSKSYNFWPLCYIVQIFWGGHEKIKKSANFIWRYFYVRKGWEIFSNCCDLLRIIELYSLHRPNSYLNKRNLQYKRTVFKFSLFDQDVK